jgi:hypothetical protein
MLTNSSIGAGGLLAILSILATLSGSAWAAVQVTESHLPTGAGIAARFTADREIATHTSVIFGERFETDSYKQHWDEARDEKGEVLSLVRLGGGDDPFGRSLQVTSVLGRDTGGGLTKWFTPADPVFIRYYTRFAPDCDYVHHFVTLRANKSLEGRDRWSGFGGAGLKPAGDGRFSTALEPWGNWSRWPAPGRWNSYSYWHEMTASPDGKYWGNSFKPDDQPDIVKDRWICAEFMLKHNTPGERDGEQAFWIDGKLMGHWCGISWRTTSGLMANALTLESYVTDRWTRNPTNIVYFDNLVIAREYIGPVGEGDSAK